ncbi:Putative GATA transcription factor 22 [Striga hermonthica]|uniref:GATA transcription factor 22 n=1 Tax=Striga hermonthica TaxID=68872 RepID=A0A9N7P2C7_STRHE|nr:Putative GATA transcription factor 22 [Striga hermonthica]
MPSPFPMQHETSDESIDPLPFGPNNNPSSSSVSCRISFDSTHDHGTGYYHDDCPGVYRSQHVSDDNHGDYNHNHGGSTYEMKSNRVDQSGLKVTLWKKEDREEHADNTHHPVKWMSSKMRMMHKIKSNPDRVTIKITKNKLENQTSSFESDNSSFAYTGNNNPVRVCSDCNTTKTPLWRSGPKGPKSLCNACGIRQRKARRAMAAAAAAANGTTVTTSNHQTPKPIKLKVKNAHLKKRFKTTTCEAGLQSTGKKKMGFEDFLVNLSKSTLSFHRVFPEDEKDAAILLMALSSGMLHG